MPEDRMLHPRLGLSVKVSSLSDLEYRVWSQMLLCADDFGVLPWSATLLMGHNLALAKRQSGDVGLAMDAVVGIGLFMSFEHQDQRFLCDPKWQSFQHVKYPRKTYYPCPPPDVLAVCDEKTIELFRNFHGMFPKSPSPDTRADLRLTANGIRLTASEAEAGFERFWTAYPRRVGRDAARQKWREAMKRADIQEILDGLDRQLPSLQQRETTFIPHPKTWLSQGRWADEVEEPKGLSRVMGVTGKTKDNAGVIERFVERHAET